MLRDLTTITTAEFRKRLAEYLMQVRYGNLKYVVTARGRDTAVILSIREYERLLDIEARAEEIQR